MNQDIVVEYGSILIILSSTHKFGVYDALQCLDLWIRSDPFLTYICIPGNLWRCLYFTSCYKEIAGFVDCSCKIFLFKCSMISCLLFPSSSYFTINICFEVNISPCIRLVEFIHTLSQEYRETRTVQAFLFPSLKSWPLCFHCFSNTLSRILSVLMLVQETLLFI